MELISMSMNYNECRKSKSFMAPVNDGQIDGFLQYVPSVSGNPNYALGIVQQGGDNVNDGDSNNDGSDDSETIASFESILEMVATNSSLESDSVFSAYEPPSQSSFSGSSVSIVQDRLNQRRNQQPPRPFVPQVFIVVCKKHKVYNNNLIKWHDFFKNNFNPGMDLNGTQLPKINLKDRPFLAPIMVRYFF
jgi:hypothetical protein